jgi:N-acetylglucosaminyl-diphospho-decaprenol L-rhamnosyltransferase
MSTEALDATVLIVNYRTPELVEACVSSVRATSAGLRLRILIVDNASGDGSPERLRASLPDTDVIENPENRGFGAGVNAGFRAAGTDVVIVLNPDTTVAAGALQALLRRLRAHPRTGVVAPLLEHGDGRLQPSGYRRFPNLMTLCVDMSVPVSYALAAAPRMHPHVLLPAALERGGAVSHVCGAAMAIRRDAYDDAGPFDEAFFMYLEETEWQQRVSRCGWAIEIEPQARVRHLVRGGGDAALVPTLEGVRSALLYTRRRGVPPPVARAAFAVTLLSSALTLLLISLLPGKPSTLRRQAREHLLLLRALA